MHLPHSGVCQWLVQSGASRSPSFSHAISISRLPSTRFFSQQPTFAHSILSSRYGPRATYHAPCIRLLGIRSFSVQSQLRDRHPSHSGDTNTLSGNTIESLLSKTHQGSKTNETSVGHADTQSLPGPLDGIRVLDLTRVLGAEVIKIENPRGGDDTRAWGPPFAQNKDPNDASPRESAYFLGVNRNKKSITVNLRSDQGRQLVHDL
ncbi:hypothetical protein BGZ93_009771, partial [Podila epicladia]